MSEDGSIPEHLNKYNSHSISELDKDWVLRSRMLEDEVVLSSLQETKNVIATIATKVSKSLFNKFGKAVVYNLGRSLHSKVSTPF